MNSSTLISSMPMLMPALSGIANTGNDLPLEARERRPRVGERVDPDAEPRHPVAARDAEHAEREDDRDALRREVLQDAEVDDDDDPDEQLQDGEELALLEQVGLARLVDQLGDLAHRAVDRQRLQLRVDHQAEHQAEQADPETQHQEGAPVDAHELGLAEVGQHQARLTTRVRRRRGRRLDRRLLRHRGGNGRQRKDSDRQQHSRECPPPPHPCGSAIPEQSKHVHVTSLSG